MALIYPGVISNHPSVAIIYPGVISNHPRVAIIHPGVSLKEACLKDFDFGIARAQVLGGV